MADDDLDTDEPTEGEFVELDEDESDVEDTEDGGAIVKLDDSPKEGDSEFLSNLAETMDESALNRLATDFVDLITRDKEARSKRDKQYEEGIRRTGLGDDAPGGATFEGASKVVHPLLTEVCVDFSARAIKELFPANGPVKSKIVGDVTKERVAKAQRKSDFMNWQLTTQSPEFRAELEQLLTQVPLGGAQYMKITWDEAKNRPSFMFVAIDDIYLPYAATNFYTAQRKTHVQYITKLEYQKRVKSGMYRDVDIVAPGMVPDRSRSDMANDKIEGRSESVYNEDGLRTVFEIYAICDIEEDPEADGPAPYILSVDKTTNTVLSIYRNWDEDDPAQEELQWIVEFPFVPWRGAYPIGIVHMIGGISAATTGALRALMDAAHISNSQTMIKLKGGRGGQTLNIQPTEILEVEGGLNVDDVRKLAMPLPFNQPSGTLFQLLGFLVDAGKGVVRTTMESSAESDVNMPVGTKLANIEQGMVVYSAIHGRMHNAIERVLSVLHRLNGMYLDDKTEVQTTGSLVASRSDFNGPMDVVPVSDPNIFSEAQRFAQVQAVAQRAQLNPQLYDLRKVEERIIATLKIPNGEEMLAPKVSPTEENAVSENVKAALGRPIVAFPDQDHIAHLKTHIPFMQSPIFGSSQLIAPTLLPGMINHLKEHIVLWYAAEVFDTASEVTDESLTEMMGKTKGKKDKQALDRLIAEASMDVVLGATEVFGELPPIIGQAIALMQQTQPPPPVDPAVEVAKQDVQMRGQLGQEKLKVDAAKIADKDKDRATKLQEVQIREAAETERTRIEDATKRGINDADNQTAEKLALLDIANGDRERAHASQNPNPNPE